MVCLRNIRVDILHKEETENNNNNNNNNNRYKINKSLFPKVVRILKLVTKLPSCVTTFAVRSFTVIISTDYRRTKEIGFWQEE
jgi:hypothetical protein